MLQHVSVLERASEHRRIVVNEIASRVQNQLRKVDSGARVVAFGSSAQMLDRDTSDVDLTYNSSDFALVEKWRKSLAARDDCAKLVEELKCACCRYMTAQQVLEQSSQLVDKVINYTIG
jgi:DNA polymerase sigma